ncbi:hypothetical protein DPMN_009442 [Dreissena polymorpha]|uniref:Uncharacterized protein n=1 Tax=Dreissena polymorpha TaxID=45954 RepID=A0A9D4S048_DREPO|nr:hypothetical protein DPMN_009442 [Dreissena polymorpha]
MQHQHAGHEEAAVELRNAVKTFPYSFQYLCYRGFLVGSSSKSMILVELVYHWAVSPTTGLECPPQKEPREGIGVHYASFHELQMFYR